eukprot:204231_1
MSTGLRSFIPYTLWRHGWKYTKPKYYRHLIHRHLKQNPTASAKSIQTLFTNGIQQYHEDIKFNADTVWSDGSFATIVGSIRQGIAKDIDDIKPHKFATNHLQAARELHDFFDGITEDDTIKILNKYCHLYLPKGSVKYGDCILAIKTVGEMLTSLTARYRSKVAQIAKQTILTSLARTDANGHILNNEFIRNLNNNKIEKSLVQKISQIRTKYDSNESLYLYDRKFDSKYKEFNKTLPAIKECILQYFTDKTSPSPHAQDTVIIDHTTGDKPGFKPEHRIQSIQGTAIQFYADWITDEGNRICSQYNQPLPSYTTFYGLMPVWVKISDQGQGQDK